MFREPKTTHLRQSLRGTIFAIAAIAVLFQVSPAQAACPGDVHATAGRFAYAGSSGATNGPAILFAGSGCTGMAQGAATGCNVNINTSSAYLSARWPSASALQGDSTGGCTFNCENGSCFVGNDGLPVELLRFGIE